MHHGPKNIISCSWVTIVPACLVSAEVDPESLAVPALAQLGEVETMPRERSWDRADGSNALKATGPLARPSLEPRDQPSNCIIRTPMECPSLGPTLLIGMDPLAIFWGPIRKVGSPKNGPLCQCFCRLFLGGRKKHGNLNMRKTKNQPVKPPKMHVV